MFRFTVWAAAFGVVALLLPLLVQPTVQAQTPRTYTLSFQHDGVNTDSYVVTVDAGIVTVNVTCTGEGAARTCAGPLTMTQNVNHTVVVKAVGPFGEASSVPFVAAPPAAPGVVKIRFP